MLTEYQRQLRERFLDAPVLPAPDPWRPVSERRTPIGGLLGVGFPLDPVTGNDLLTVVSGNGHGVFDGATGDLLARTGIPTRSSARRPARTCPARESALSPAPGSVSRDCSAADCTPPPTTAGP